MLDPAHAYVFLLLTATSVAYQLVFQRWERLRRAVTNNRVPDLLSIWTFAAVAALPLTWAMAAIVIYYVPDWNPRSTGKGPRVVQFGKLAYSVLAVEAAAVAASNVLRLFGAWSLPCAVLIFVAVNFGLILLAVIASGQRAALPMLLRPKAHALELAGQCMGAGLAVTMAWHNLVILAALPLLIGLHAVASRDAVLAFDSEQMRLDTGYRSVMIVDMRGSSEPQRLNILRSSVGEANPISMLGGLYVVFAATETPWAADLLVARIERWLDTAGVFATVGVATGVHGTVKDLVRDARRDLAARLSDSADV